MNLPRHLFAIAALVPGLLAGCAIIPPHDGPRNPVHDADASVTQHCRYVGEVTGRFAGTGSGSSDANATAKDWARYQASAMGATDIHWTHGSSSTSIEGPGETVFVGDAYRCGKK